MVILTNTIVIPTIRFFVVTLIPPMFMWNYSTYYIKIILRVFPQVKKNIRKNATIVMVRFMVGKIIKTMRRENNFSQEELAQKVYLGRTTLSDYEREKTDINFDNLEKIANACGYEILFVNKKDNTKILTSKNINRKEI